MMRSAGRTSVKTAKGRFAAGLRGSASALAIGAIFSSSAAWAQPADSAAQPADAAQPAAAQPAATEQPTNDQAIVVTGIRASLANSQNIKRNSDTVVDAITAQDIGALPDRSVTEALQRVPGVEINRFAGSNDPDHFSVEGSGVVIRGLSFVRSEFNSRDTFSTGVYGQAINFSDVPAELLGSVAVYKNATAEMIEGGLSGTVDLRTRLPFDNHGGFHLAFDGEYNYGDFSERWAPTGSLLVSDTFDTSLGRIGLLADVSYSQLYSRADGIQVSNFQTRNNTFATNNAAGAPASICRTPLPSSTDTTGFGGTSCTSPSTPGANGLADPFADTHYAPVGGQFRTQDFNRRRFGIAAAMQWESLDHRAHLTAQFLRSDSHNDWGEHVFQAGSDLSEYNTFPAGCHQNGNGDAGRIRAECRVSGSGFVFTGNDRGNGYTGAATQFPNSTVFPNYQYGADNVFESGFITFPGTGWRTNDSGSATTRVPTGGMQNTLDDRQVSERNIVTDYGMNFRFDPSAHWAINLDVDHVHAEHNDLDFSVMGSDFADQEINLTGAIPQITPHKPLTLSATWAAPNPNMAAQTDSQYFNDPRWEFWRSAMDHMEHSTGDEWAFQGDVAYNFDEGSFLRRIKFGARYADRAQTIRYTTYNWGALSEVWSAPGTAVFMDQIGGSNISFNSFPNFFRGQANGPPGGNYYNGDLIDGYDQAVAFFRSIANQWRLNGATANPWVPLASRPGVIPGTPYLPTEVQRVDEENSEAYAMLSFGNDEPLFGNVRMQGNIGVRFVHTDLTSAGSIAFPTQQNLGVQQPFAQRCALVPPPPGAPAGTPPSQPGGICNIGQAAYDALRTFAGDGTATPNVANNTYTYWLPSLNVRFGLTRDLLLRFAASRALARPGLADVRNFIQTSFDNNTNSVTTTAGNPFLRPALSDQFDLTLEWYFARVGSLTLDGFYKRVHNFFYQSITGRPVTNNGVTETFVVRGPANYPGTGKVSGFEIAYQQTFDFLPWIFSGLGISANYTYIHSSGLPNSFLNGGAPSNVGPVAPGTLPLEQLSKHNINVQAFYERGPISLRVAYNWRSRFLLTASDVIFPYFPIFNASTGQLDASFFFSITPQLKIGVQGVNLLNEVTRTEQQFTADGLIGPRSYFMNDRRFAFIVRGSF